MRSVHIVLLASLTLVAMARAQRACDAHERCVTLTQCPSLARLLKKTMTAAERDLLRNSVCVRQSPERPSLPKVCCPLVPVANCGAINTPDRIIGGNQTVVKEIPWAVRLGYRFRGRVNYKCGGSLINENYVLTAAHCVAETLKPSSVRLGEHDTESDVDCSVLFGKKVCADPVVDVDIEEIVPHPDYEPDTRKRTGLWNDVALLRLSRRVTMTSSVSPVCLPLTLANSNAAANAGKFAEASLVVVGWGQISAEQYGATSRYLLKLHLRPVPQPTCAAKYSDFPNAVDPDRHLCAIGKDGTDACKGDSGGPLTTVTYLDGRVRTVLQGVVSYGPSTCATKGVPAVFTRVSYYMPWILSNLRP